jgi:hypothetical protein
LYSNRERVDEHCRIPFHSLFVKPQSQDMPERFVETSSDIPIAPDNTKAFYPADVPCQPTIRKITIIRIRNHQHRFDSTTIQYVVIPCDTDERKL